MCKPLTSNNRPTRVKADRVRHAAAAGEDVVVDAAAPDNAAMAARVRHRPMQHRLNRRARKTAPSQKLAVRLKLLNRRM